MAMELRRFTPFHFINVIKGNSVEKSMNVDSRGRPGLKFKEIKEIYNFRDTIDPNEVPRICLRDDLESSPAKCYGVKVDNPDFSLVRGVKIKTEFEASDLSCSNAGDERADDLDDLSFGTMTLRQLKKKCKSKKRKRSNFLNKDEENDLEEPLIMLKSKLSKNLKRKRKSSRKSVSATSPNAVSLVKSEKFYLDEDILQPNQNSPSPAKVEVEVPESGHSKCQAISGVTSGSDFSYGEQVDSIVFVPKDVLETTDAHVLEMEVPYPTNKPQHCVLNEVSYEYRGNLESKFDVGVSGWDIVKVDSPAVLSYEYPDLQEFGQESYPVYAPPCSISPESMPPTNDFKSNSSEDEMAWQISSYDRTELLEMENDNSLQCLENINEGSARGSPSVGKQFQLSDSVETDVDAMDKPMASQGHPDNHQREQQQHPERLLSSRKAISPVSQEKLRRAMELTELDDDQRQECRGKLYFGKHNNHRIVRAQGLDQLGKDGATIKPKSFLRKVKQDKKGSPTKGILKVTHRYRSVPHVSNACPTIQRCTQSAIAFTQRQMHDIESLATKLTTELNSMKDIVMGKLHSELEVSAATAMNKNNDEVRIAVDSATKAEETARKWLSMMARDCNRFHKIMKLTEDSSASSERVIQKERKISFADEVGGKLCHIKVIKDDMVTASSQLCDIEKQRLQVE